MFWDLTEWFEEFRPYHRKDGIVVKMDDALDASRATMTMLRHARTARPAVPMRAKAPGWVL